MMVHFDEDFIYRRLPQHARGLILSPSKEAPVTFHIESIMQMNFLSGPRSQEAHLADIYRTLDMMATGLLHKLKVKGYC